MVQKQSFGRRGIIDKEATEREGGVLVFNNLKTDMIRKKRGLVNLYLRVFPNGREYNGLIRKTSVIYNRK